MPRLGMLGARPLHRIRLRGVVLRHRDFTSIRLTCLGPNLSGVQLTIGIWLSRSCHHFSPNFVWESRLWRCRCPLPLHFSPFSLTGDNITARHSANCWPLEPTQPPIQWVPGALSLGVKRPGRDDDHSSPSSVEVRNVWSYNSTPPMRLHDVVLS
jgi:hypothetical protein